MPHCLPMPNPSPLPTGSPDRRQPASRRHGITIVAALMAFALASPLAARVSPPPVQTASTAKALPTGAQCSAIALASPDAAAPPVASAADAWGGPRPEGATTLSDRVVKYVIDATLDPTKHTVSATQQLTWRNRSAQPVCSIYLHLYLNAFQSAGSTFFTEKARGFNFRSNAATGDTGWGYIRLDAIIQGGANATWTYVQPDNGPASDRTVVRVDLPQPVPAGGSTTLDMRFFDQLPRVVARTGYFDTFHLVAQWFPKVAVLELPGERGATAPRWNAHEMHMNSEFYSDFGSYDVTLRVPKGYTVGATGELQGQPLEANGLMVHRYVQEDVHDFAWTADNKTAPPLETTWTHPGSPPVKVRVLAPSEFAHNRQPVMKATLDALEWFSRTLGPYPYRTVTAVVPPHNAPEAGGMEYPTFFTAANTDRYVPGTISQYMIDFVTVHEFGHGYFYGILASNEFEEPTLDEGVNQYWDDRLLRTRGQGIRLTTPWMRRLGLAPAMDLRAMERLTAGLDDPQDRLGQNAWSRLGSRSYSTVYSRMATQLNDIEAMIGGEAMERGMRLYYQRWKFRHPSLMDFRDALAEGSGRPDVVLREFDNSIFHARRLDDAVDSISVRELLPTRGFAKPGGESLTSEQANKAVTAAREAWKAKHPNAKSGGPYPFESTVVIRRNGTATTPRQLRVTFDDGSVETATVDSDQRWVRYRWTRDAKAVRAELDPDGLQGMDASQLDNARSTETTRMSMGARVMAWLQLSLLQGLLL